MAGVAQIPRSRGAVCGTLLILLGAWDGLIPFIGPYFHFAYTPDKAWAYTSGRLYLSVLPGAAALLGGLLVLLTRSRAVGIVSGFLAVLGGAWAIAGDGVVLVIVKSTTVTPGTPVGTLTSSGVFSIKMYAEDLGFFTGIGMVIIFVGALAIGRFSMIAARDAAGADDYEPDQDGQGLPTVPQPGGQSHFPAATDQYPTVQSGLPGAQGPFTPGQERPQATTGQFPTAAGQFPPKQDPFPTASGQFPPSPEQKFPPPDQFPTPRN
jgi:hypothetical protein